MPTVSNQCESPGKIGPTLPHGMCFHLDLHSVEAEKISKNYRKWLIMLVWSISHLRTSNLTIQANYWIRLLKQQPLKTGYGIPTYVAVQDYTNVITIKALLEKFVALQEISITRWSIEFKHHLRCAWLQHRWIQSGRNLPLWSFSVESKQHWSGIPYNNEEKNFSTDQKQDTTLGWCSDWGLKSWMHSSPWGLWAFTLDSREKSRTRNGTDGNRT